MKKRSGLLHYIFPPERDFFGLLEEHAALTVEAAESLCRWLDVTEDRLETGIQEIEHRGDELRSKLGGWLAEVFVTPMGREDLDRMSRTIDEVIDYLRTTVKEIVTLEVEPDEVMREMAEVLHRGTREIHLAVSLLRKDREGAASHAMNAKRTENEIETIYRRAVRELLRGDDFRQILKKREIYRHLSNAGDRLDEAADELWMAILKNA